MTPGAIFLHSSTTTLEEVGRFVGMAKPEDLMLPQDSLVTFLGEAGDCRFFHGLIWGTNHFFAIQGGRHVTTGDEGVKELADQRGFQLWRPGSYQLSALVKIGQKLAAGIPQS